MHPLQGHHLYHHHHHSNHLSHQLSPTATSAPCTNAPLPPPPANSPPYLTDPNSHHPIHQHHPHQVPSIHPHLHQHTLTNLNHQPHHSHHYHHHQLTAAAAAAAHHNTFHAATPLDSNSSNSSNSSNNHSVETLNTSSPNSNHPSPSSSSTPGQLNPISLHYSLGSATSGISPGHIYNHSPLAGGLPPHTPSPGHPYHHPHHHLHQHLTGGMRSPDTAIQQTSMQLSVHSNGKLLILFLFLSLFLPSSPVVSRHSSYYKHYLTLFKLNNSLY